MIVTFVPSLENMNKTLLLNGKKSTNPVAVLEFPTKSINGDKMQPRLHDNMTWISIAVGQKGSLFSYRRINKVYQSVFYDYCYLQPWWQLMFIIDIIHPTHRRKSSHLLTEGHMTWIILDNVHWSMCVSVYYFHDSQKSCYSCRIWNSIWSTFPNFTIKYRLNKSMNWVYLNKYWLLFYLGNDRKLLHPR